MAFVKGWLRREMSWDVGATIASGRQLVPSLSINRARCFASTGAMFQAAQCGSGSTPALKAGGVPPSPTKAAPDRLA